MTAAREGHTITTSQSVMPGPPDQEAVEAGGEGRGVETS